MDDFDWTIGNNGSMLEGTGPPLDHTMGTDLGRLYDRKLIIITIIFHYHYHIIAFT